jgi:hypothetical protein
MGKSYSFFRLATFSRSSVKSDLKNELKRRGPDPRRLFENFGKEN